MPEALLDPRDLSPRARATALLLLAAVVLGAVAGQAHFAAAASGDVHDDLDASQRNLGLLWYALAVAWTVLLCRWTRGWLLPAWSRSPWRLCLVALVCLSGWLRFHRLEELPPGLWIDEALNGVQAVRIAESGRPLAALGDADPRSGLGAGYVDVAGLAFALFDPDDGPWGLRAVAAVLGTAGVAALAALAWALYGPRAAVAATAWLAVSQWHVNYSRWGEMPIMSPLFETLVVLGLTLGLGARGWRSWGGFLLAGLSAGLGLYTYQTFRLCILLAAAAGAVIALAHRQAVAARARQLAAAFLLATVIASPMLHYAATRTAEFSERARETFILGRADWRQQIARSVPRSLLAFQVIGDDNPRHNLPFAPLLGGVAAMLAAIGLAVCIARWRMLPFALVPIWFAITLMPGMLTLEAPHASRLLDAIVPLALMIGVAADLLLGVVQAALPGRGGASAVALLLLTGAALAARQEYRAYFVERETRPEFSDAFSPWESAPGRYLAAHAPSATVFLDPTTYWSPDTHFVARRYLAALPNDVRMLRLQHDFPPTEPLGRDALYLLPKPYAPLATVIRSFWKEARCEDVRDRLGRLTMTACRVPQAAVEERRERAASGALRSPYGLRGRFYGPDSAETEVTLAFPFIEYPLDEPPLGRFAHAEWDGFIDIAQAGEYAFRLHPDTTTLTIDGRPVIHHAGARAFGGGNEGRVTLPAGRLPIRITLEPGAAGRYFLWFLWQPPDAEVEIVPPTVLHPPAGAAVDAER
jgi:Dolichyl-phosphate-mannose-protein mannosyltransferase